MQASKEIDREAVLIDSTTIPIHRHGSGALKKSGKQAIGRGRKGVGTKIHLAAVKEGVMSIYLSPAQKADCIAIETLWENWPWSVIKTVIADRGYASSAIRSTIQSHGARAIIPYKKPSVPSDTPFALFDHPDDAALYQQRNSIEHLFSTLKENKRIATRFDKLDSTFLAFTALALIVAFKFLC